VAAGLGEREPLEVGEPDLGRHPPHLRRGLVRQPRRRAERLLRVFETDTGAGV